MSLPVNPASTPAILSTAGPSSSLTTTAAAPAQSEDIDPLYNHLRQLEQAPLHPQGVNVAALGDCESPDLSCPEPTPDQIISATIDTALLATFNKIGTALKAVYTAYKDYKLANATQEALKFATKEHAKTVDSAIRHFRDVAKEAKQQYRSDPILKKIYDNAEQAVKTSHELLETDPEAVIAVQQRVELQLQTLENMLKDLAGRKLPSKGTTPGKRLPHHK